MTFFSKPFLGEDSTLRSFSTVTDILNKSFGVASYNRKLAKKKGKMENPVKMEPIIGKFIVCVAVDFVYVVAVMLQVALSSFFACVDCVVLCCCCILLFMFLLLLCCYLYCC